MSSIVQLFLLLQVNELLLQTISDKTRFVIGQKGYDIFIRRIKTNSRFVFCKVRNESEQNKRLLVYSFNDI